MSHPEVEDAVQDVEEEPLADEVAGEDHKPCLEVKYSSQEMLLPTREEREVPRAGEEVVGTAAVRQGLPVLLPLVIRKRSR
jgi:hypothetical protein